MNAMKSKNVKLLLLLSIVGLSSVLLTSCKEELFATVTFTETGSDLGGDVTGDGGSRTQSYKWNNSLSIADADGNNVLNQTLVVGQGDDSKSGVSNSGTAGEWTVTVTLTDFNGDGSFSISPGN